MAAIPWVTLIVAVPLWPSLMAVIVTVSDALFSELSLALSRTGGIGLADAMAGPLLRQTAGAGSTSPG